MQLTLAMLAQLMGRTLEITHPETLSGLRPVKFEQLEARVHLNTVTWPYSRYIGRVVEVGDRSAWLDAGSRTFGLDWSDLNSRLLEKAS